MNSNLLFAQAQEDLAHGRFADCLAKTEALLGNIGTHFAILHLQALAHRGLGQIQKAHDAFEHAVALMSPPGDAFLLANFASLLVILGRYEQALLLYQRASKIAPDNAEIHNRHITLIRALNGDDAADGAFASLLRNKPNNAELRHYYALFLADCGQCQRALAELSLVKSQRPNSINARLLYDSIALDVGIEVRDDLGSLYRSHPDEAKIGMAFAASLARSGKAQDAVDILLASYRKSPLNADILTSLIAITQQQLGFSEVESLLIGLHTEFPGNPVLAFQASTYFWRHHGGQAGLAHLRTVKDRLNDPMVLALIEAELCSEIDLYDEANDLFARLSTGSVENLAAEMRHRIRNAEYEKGQEIAEHLAFQFGHVEGWTQCESLWRLRDDPRWHWLVGNDAFISDFRLPRFDEYQDGLIDALTEAHALEKNHPLGQSPRGGTQTDGILFRSGHPGLRALVIDIKQILDRYIAKLPRLEANHPMALLQRIGHHFTGSWSIRLASQGFHKPHFHNLGKISSACYIRLPEEVTGVPESKEAGSACPGWLEFGRPPSDLRLSLEPFKMLQPKEGHLALFPSFLWHGTRPFERGERLVVAFDVNTIPLI